MEGRGFYGGRRGYGCHGDAITLWVGSKERKWRLWGRGQIWGVVTAMAGRFVPSRRGVVYIGGVAKRKGGKGVPS